MERRVRGNSHARCGVGENLEMASKDYLSLLFEKITNYEELSVSFGGKNYRLALMHYPILFWNGQHRGTILLYAHTHNSAEDAYFQKCITEINASKELSLRRQGGQKIVAINVGCMKEYVDYEPRSLQELLEGMGKPG